MKPNVKKVILFLGAGHANIQALRFLCLKKEEAAQLILVSPQTQAPYSGMLPSFLMGDYQFQQLHFDLRSLSQNWGFELVVDEALEIIARENTVKLKSGSQLSYDLLSVNVGISPQRLDALAEAPESLLYVKPISEYLKRWNLVTTKKPSPEKMVVVGGGAAAFELAIASRSKFVNASIILITGAQGLLTHFPKSTIRKAKKALVTNRIDLIEQNPIRSLSASAAMLSNSQKIQFDQAIIAVSAKGPSLIQSSSIPKTLDNFVKVSDTLQIQGLENAFATGDCIYFDSHPLPKAGVYAVRQGPLLAENLRRHLHQKPLKKYRPQKRFLTILVSGPQKAIASYGLFSVEGNWVWKMKRWIDQRFMNLGST